MLCLSMWQADVDQSRGKQTKYKWRDRVAKSDLNSTEAYFATKNKHQKMAQKWPKTTQNSPKMTQNCQNDPKWPKN